MLDTFALIVHLSYLWVFEPSLFFILLVLHGGSGNEPKRKATGLGDIKCDPFYIFQWDASKPFKISLLKHFVGQIDMDMTMTCVYAFKH